MIFESVKTYGHNIGLSACFRQWRATSHCRFLHGYPLSFRIRFAASELDHNNWVVDFGALKPLKAQLEDLFDHKLLVARDDPEASTLLALQKAGMAEVRIVENVGCEAFARMVFAMAEVWLHKNLYKPRVWVDSVECREHDANGAIYRVA